MIKDLTKGSPIKAIISFAVPMLFGNLFQQMYNMADSIIVGKYIGVKALAAVGGTGALNFLVLGFIIGVSSGFMIPVSQAFGAKDFDRLRKYVTNAAWLSLITGLLITVITVAFTGEMLRLTNTPDDIFQGSYEYIATIFAGILGIMFYNLLSGIMRALGDSKTPLYFLIFSSFINIALDLLFVIVFKIGVFGAAFATDISQFISCVLCFLFIKKKYSILKMKKRDFTFNWGLSKRLLIMGIPMGLQYSITAIGSTAMQTAVNGLGSVYVAAVTAGNKVSLLFTQAYDTLGTAMATFCGQNLGAKKLDRINKGMKQGIIAMGMYTVFAFFAIIFGGRYVALLFVNADEAELLGYVSKFLFANAAFYFPLGLLIILRYGIQGLGHSVFAMIAGIMEMIARCAVAFLGLAWFGVDAIYYSNAAAWIAANIFLIPAFIMVMKKIKKIIIQNGKTNE